MSADDAAQGQGAPARRGRRGRPPGSASKAGARTRRKRLGGPELTEQLNHMVAELIKENRKLKRQVVKLTERGTKVASNTVDRTLRTIQRRVQKALTAPAKRKRRKTAVAATTRKKAVTRKRGKTT
jgi:septum formation inhibitor MinC